MLWKCLRLFACLFLMVLGVNVSHATAYPGADQWANWPIIAPEERATLVHGYFSSTESQLDQIRRLNTRRGWGFTEAEFTQAAAAVPSWPDAKGEELTAVVLVPYLPADAGLDGVNRTYRELCLAMVDVYNITYTIPQESPFHMGVWEGGVYTNTELRYGLYLHGAVVSNEHCPTQQLTLLPGVQHRPGLRWETIRLGANVGKDPVKGRSKLSPHAGVMAAAVLHPYWARSMTHFTYRNAHPDLPFWAPAVSMAGYVVEGKKNAMPMLSHNCSQGRYMHLELVGYWLYSNGLEDRYVMSYGVPEFYVAPTTSP